MSLIYTLMYILVQNATHNRYITHVSLHVSLIHEACVIAYIKDTCFMYHRHMPHVL